MEKIPLRGTFQFADKETFLTILGACIENKRISKREFYATNKAVCLKAKDDINLGFYLNVGFRSNLEFKLLLTKKMMSKPMPSKLFKINNNEDGFSKKKQVRLVFEFESIHSTQGKFYPAIQ